LVQVIAAKQVNDVVPEKVSAYINSVGTIHCELIYGRWNLPFTAASRGSKSTPPHTSTKANKVPILVRLVTSVRFKNKAGIATTNPVTIVANDGVWNLGWMRENAFGNKPSRLMLIQMRGWPSWNISNTLAVAITALMEIT
jgi:hypothetical protein